MNKVAEINVPACGLFSFPLPIPKGTSPLIPVFVGGIARRTRKVTDRVILVQGAHAPGPADVSVGALGDRPIVEAPNTLDTRVEVIIGESGIDQHSFAHNIDQWSFVHEGLRYSVFLDRFQGAITGTLEIANAEWTEGKHPGPLKVPKVDIRGMGTLYYPLTDGTEGTLNPREHITRRFAYAQYGQQGPVGNGQHLIQCTGDWSYESIAAWGPQMITIEDLNAVAPVRELHSRVIGQGSPCRAIGFPGGNETGGFLIEYAYRPGLAGTELYKLLDLSDCMMERESIWTYFEGEPMNAVTAAVAYGGIIPFRVEPTSVPHLMIPTYFEGFPEGHYQADRYPGNWQDGHLPKVNHGWKAHDGQHLVRMTALLKSAIWNCGDQYAMHCMKQVGAHAMLCKSDVEHKDEGWGYENTLYDMLNREPNRGDNLGVGVGKREDAWLSEAVLMNHLLFNEGNSLGWLRDCASIIRTNILLTGVGVQKGNHIVESRAMGLTSGNGPKAVHAP